MEKLKPCPFCGGEAKLVHSEPGREDRIWCIVRCKDWNCTGHHLNVWYATDEDAADHWNTRYEYEWTCTPIRADVESAGIKGTIHLCSKCYRRVLPDDKYCPNCGAKVVKS